MYTAWVEISKSAILHNLSQYQRLVGNQVEIMPVVKSNAYGHGMAEVAKLVESKISWLAVASLGEAIRLRKNKIRKRIFVLSYAPQELLEQGIKLKIDLPVYDLENAKLISKTAVGLKRLARIHIKIDTGTSRVGVLPKQALEFIEKINKLPNIKIEGLYSHFAASEEDKLYTKKQLEHFNNVLTQNNLTIPFQHFACSAASLVEPLSHFNMIRLGLALYGLWPSDQVRRMVKKKYSWFDLRPALTWKTKIIQVKELPAGTKIGYGGTYTVKKKTKLAVLAVGYWEGYDRHLSNLGEVMVKGIRCRVLGRVCMNLTMIDVSRVKNVKTGDEVILLGGEITAEEMAEKIKTINYEVVTRINPVLERKYLK